jgi:hypothetical protein
MSGWAKLEDPAPGRGGFISTTYSIVVLTHYCDSSSLIFPPSLLRPRHHFVAMSAKVEVEVEDAVKTLPDRCFLFSASSFLLITLESDYLCLAFISRRSRATLKRFSSSSQPGASYNGVLESISSCASLDFRLSPALALVDVLFIRSS